MIENLLKNIAYLYYPKGICSINEREEYNSSEEFQRLISITNTFYQNDDNKTNYDLLFNELKKQDLIKNIQDNTTFHFDRCITFELDIVEGEEKLIKICLNISLLVPYYALYILENDITLNPYKWVTIPKRNQTKETNEYKEHLETIALVVEKITTFNKFPEKLANVVLPNLTYQSISKGSFTLFNAFFGDENKLN